MLDLVEPLRNSARFTRQVSGDPNPEELLVANVTSVDAQHQRVPTGVRPGKGSASDWSVAARSSRTVKGT